MSLCPDFRRHVPPAPSAPAWCREVPGPGEKLPGRMAAPRVKLAHLDDPPLCCAACRAPVTTDSRRISVAGEHRHVFANPHGLVFAIGCFSAAPGCMATGPVTPDFSWFAGTSWQTAVCAVCRLHLGWRYLPGTGGYFYGLILDRLVTGPGAAEA